MAFIPAAHRALLAYVAQVGGGEPFKQTLKAAVILTEAQRDLISAALGAFWGREMACPLVLDVKPQHGFQSRVLKDGFSPEKYVEWLVLGCSDVAEVDVDPKGRPNLIVRGVRENGGGAAYDVLVPIRSNADGFVHVDDVIPRGLPPRQKKAAPSALPKTT